VARELAGSIEPAVLGGHALEHARATVSAAMSTLERLAEDGWRAVLGDALDGAERVQIGEDSVAERSETFDPFARAIAAVG
jgi:ribosomal protein S12 methylthiotransferase accessory factor YcaO